MATKHLAVCFDEEHATFSIFDTVAGVALLSGAGLMCDAITSIQGTVPNVRESVLESPLLGYAVRVQLEFPGSDGLNLIWEIALFEDSPIVLMRLGVCHRGLTAVRVRKISPCHRGLILNGQVSDPSQVATLDGQAGAGLNRVIAGTTRDSPNNLLVYLRSPTHERSIVAGGLTYRDFAKYVDVEDDGINCGIRLSLEGRDPIGRLVNPGQDYMAEDWYYLDLLGTCPFEALERYAQWVRRCNSAMPCPYYFPTVCGWYASMPNFGGGKWINHSTGMVEELEAAARKGFMRYTALGVRLVPDTYDGTATLHQDARAAGMDPRRWSADRNTEQGWWDDVHWQRHGHYTMPYETSEKWATAVKARGGIPITYVQTGHVSHDYAKAFPGHMLGNDISRLDEKFIGHQPHVVYDYTDPDFRAHLRRVWNRLGRAGVQGVFFDYPEQGWIEGAGFEDKEISTAAAYRGVFDLVKPALGPVSYVQERNFHPKAPYLDVTVGLVDSQRIWRDTDAVCDDMYRMCALRWYKTRTLYAYDTDAKNLIKIAALGRDYLRQVLTMLYLISGRILLANSISALSSEILHDLSRLFPTHREAFTPRPLDAFNGVEVPSIYHMEFTANWYQVALLNTDASSEKEFAIPLRGRQVDGALSIEKDSEWYLWDFWNDRPVGLLKEADILRQRLRPSEARILSMRRRETNPQVVSCNRHLLQGWVELYKVRWDPVNHSLSGQLEAVAGEETIVSIACNGMVVQNIEAERGQARLLKSSEDSSDYARIGFLTELGGAMTWKIHFG